jgi:ATP-dependent helicase HrpB
VLCFLPGSFEIRRAIDQLQARGVAGEAEILPLHGSLDSEAQDLPLRPPASPRRRVIVATNIAETSVTVPGVTVVVDSGLHKVARYDADRGIDSLDVERITADAADQRAGRAARTAPGVVRRLWDARARLRPHREPEVFRVDLSSTALDVIAWGGDPQRFEWFEAPSPDAIDAALGLLARLDAIRDGALTETGRAMQRLPLHPRLARMLVEANSARQMAQACALLSERHLLPPRTASTTSDLLSAMDQWSSIPLSAACCREIEAIGSSAASQRAPSRSRDEFRRAILTGYPDRAAREPQSPKLRLASAQGPSSPQSGVTGGNSWSRSTCRIVAPNDPDARVRLPASSIANGCGRRASRSFIGRRSAWRRKRWKSALRRPDLAERTVETDQASARILADAWARRGRGRDAALRRCDLRASRRCVRSSGARPHGARA